MRRVGVMGQRVRRWLSRQILAPGFPWRALGAGSMALLVWWGAARWLVPSLIRAAYDGRVPILPRLMGRRGAIPVSEYLADWQAAIPRSLFALATLILLLLLVLVFIRQPRTRPDSPSAPDPSPDPDRELSPREILLAAGCFGLVAGLGEAYYLLGRAFLLGLVPPELREVSQDSLWMAPVADTLAFLLVGVVVVIVSRPVRRLASAGRIAGLYVFLTGWTWIAVTYRVDLWAALLLAAGVAVQAGRYVASHPRGWSPLLRRTATMAAVLTVIAAGVSTIGPGLMERRATSRLREPPADGLNVLLIVLDTERARGSSLYGNPRGTTPELERRAAAGIVFDRAIAPAPWTLPSHATMFTGLPNRVLGTGPFSPLDDRYPTLAERLRDHGYLTAAFVANVGFTSDFYGLDRGFIHYEDQPRSLGMLLSSSVLTRTVTLRLRRWLGEHGSLIRKRADEVNREFLDWLDGRGARPFFAFLNYFDAHAPYLPPAPFDTLYGAGDGRYWMKPGALEAAEYGPGELDELRATYEAAIRYLDHHLDRLLDELETRAVLDRTLVIVTSDHGEEFGEHGWVGHDNNLHLEVLHVPLVAWHPGGPAGRRVQAPVSLAELPVTILDLLGLPAHDFPGASLAPYFGPAEPAAGVSRPAISERGEDGEEWSLVSGRFHYLRGSGDGEELYDIVADPGESRDLAKDPAYAELVVRLRSALAARIDSVDVGVPRPRRP